MVDNSKWSASPIQILISDLFKNISGCESLQAVRRRSAGHFPPSHFASSASGRIDTLLQTKLREHGFPLRRLHTALRSSPEILSLPKDKKEMTQTWTGTPREFYKQFSS